MKALLKWTGIWVAVLTALALFAHLSGRLDRSPGMSALMVAGGGVLLGALLAGVEVFLIPLGRKRAVRNLVERFSGTPVTESVVHFRFLDFDLYAQVDHYLKIHPFAYLVTIDFHVPREQIDDLGAKPGPGFERDRCHDLDTYRICSTGPAGINLTDRELAGKLRPYR